MYTAMQNKDLIPRRRCMKHHCPHSCNPIKSADSPSSSTVYLTVLLPTKRSPNMLAQVFKLYKSLASDLKQAIKRIKSKISFMKIE